MLIYIIYEKIQRQQQHIDSRSTSRETEWEKCSGFYIYII